MVMERYNTDPILESVFVTVESVIVTAKSVLVTGRMFTVVICNGYCKKD